jgi:5,10-methylenetetrahydrofolate reductase
MTRSLSEAIRHRPLLFEPVPPTIRTNPVRTGLAIERLVQLLRAVPRLDGINVPELVDENHDGRPYYRSGDSRAFAKTVGEQVGRETIVNKVVAHLPSGAALSDWARETVGRGLHHLVLVGGSSRYIPYSGPTVAEANRICEGILAPVAGLLGNIAIPQRTGEARRMLAKTRAGARFFTTQILFDAESAIELVQEYDALAREAGVEPGSVLLSFAPLADEADCEFVRWLGAEIPEEVESSILNEGDSGAAARSTSHAGSVWSAVLSRSHANGWSVPLGINMEQISQRHLVSAAEMLGAFAERIDHAGSRGARESAPGHAGR